jgi:hypothetical protein
MLAFVALSGFPCRSAAEIDRFPQPASNPTSASAPGCSTRFPHFHKHCGFCAKHRVQKRKTANGNACTRGGAFVEKFHGMIIDGCGNRRNTTEEPEEKMIREKAALRSVLHDHPQEEDRGSVTRAVCARVIALDRVPRAPVADDSDAHFARPSTLVRDGRGDWAAAIRRHPLRRGGHDPDRAHRDPIISSVSTAEASGITEVCSRHEDAIERAWKC